jgi:hypothetical protein
MIAGDDSREIGPGYKTGHRLPVGIPAAGMG